MSKVQTPEKLTTKEKPSFTLKRLVPIRLIRMSGIPWKNFDESQRDDRRENRKTDAISRIQMPARRRGCTPS
jgi:hypothetical protein